MPLSSEIARLRGLFGTDSEGGALVEMAVTLPIVMAVMTGIFSFSIALYQKLQLAEAVSNAGHLLATDRGDTDPCTTATNAVYAAAPGLLVVELSLPDPDLAYPGLEQTFPAAARMQRAAADRRQPMNAYLEFDAHPARMIP